MKKQNQAQKLLCRIGGLAELVAGKDGHYFADASTPKKSHKRPYYGPEGSNGKRIKLRGSYGKSLISHFDSARAKAA